MLLRPVDRERAAAHEHDDDGLARGGDGPEQVLLRFRQVEVRAVAAAEALDLHVHLLALERGRKPQRHDDHVRFARLLERLLAQRRGDSGRPPDELGRGRGVALVILDAEFVSASGFQLDRLRQRLRAAVAPILDERLVVEEDAHAVVGPRAELVRARRGRDEVARPAGREVVGGQLRGGRVREPVEVELRVEARDGGLALQVLVVEILALQSVPAFVLGRVEGRRGDGQDGVARQGRAERVEDSRLRRDLAADAFERRYPLGRDAVVVAE